MGSELCHLVRRVLFLLADMRNDILSLKRERKVDEMVPMRIAPRPLQWRITWDWWRGLKYQMKDTKW
ncbi:hypothetical protein MAR_000395 [Mya arenaria]|uniref:Uncharacterized protein n=1 Tax=Mya arenaria TaxID=6604 RepID=A0ABY7FAC8_MYAAR|nr:hypothetical protein MAR_000395 [Mya arenaria]